MELATLLIEALAAGFDPSQYHDRYRENLRALIDAKIQGQEVADRKGAEPAPAAVIDIIRALEASLAGARKPASVVKAATAETADTDQEICRRPRKRA